MELPQLPTPIGEFLEHCCNWSTREDVENAIKPYKLFESKLREIYAQNPTHPAIYQNHLVPIFAANTIPITVKARDLAKESQDIKDQYLLALPEKQRKVTGSPAIVSSLKDFRTNFNVFSESSLVDLDWNNVVAAGSSVVTALLPLESPHNESKRAQRAYYHEVLAPASDVDLFIYGLNEEQATQKIKQIEARIRDSILSETTTIRTKNAITIVSEYPTRHVQIVLRLYKTASEILTGFDVDCSCVAFDGNEVWATPRALAAYMTQTNTIDLTRRSPSYENRLSKYSHRGFEVHWPALDRTRVDPTIFERAFSRVMGLARLLVLEKLPHPNDRDTYLAKRREERGRPPLPWNSRFRHKLPGNVKDAQPDDVAEWVEEDDVSNYHTFTVPYGPKYNAKRIEKLLFTKDLLLNAEWNRSKDRKTKLHRHPAFFGSVEDVIGDCCGFCPKPETDEDLAAADEENKIYISGDIQYLKDDPGRQAIGSFHPITADDWTEMAYVGNTSRLCQAIVDKDLEAVNDWFSSGELETVDVNRRDHAGRTPLQLATMCSTPEIVQFLIDRGARIVSRLYNGMTALHIAAHRGEVLMVKALLDRSATNEEAEERKNEARKGARRFAAEKAGKPVDVEMDDSKAAFDSDEDMESDKDDDDDDDEITEGSFVKVREEGIDMLAEDEDEPDVYDVNVLAWDSPLSPLHLAILAGRIDVIELLIDQYGADVLLPVKLFDDNDKRNPRAAILSLVLALQLPMAEARKTIESLLSHNATATQADMNQISALHYVIDNAKMTILNIFRSADSSAIEKAVNHIALSKLRWSQTAVVDFPLLSAIRTRQPEVVEAVLAMGAKMEISLEAFAKTFERVNERKSNSNPEEVKKEYQKSVQQPIIMAVKMEMLDLVNQFIDAGISVNTMPQGAYERAERKTWGGEDKSLLDLIRDRLKGLREFVDEPNIEKSQSPKLLDPDEKYLDLPQGTYQYWIASTDLEQAKGVHRHQMREHEKGLKSLEDQKESDSGKKDAARALIPKLEALEAKLLSKGAQTFYEAFTDVPKPLEDDYNRRWNYNYSYGAKPDPYETKLTFIIGDLTPATKSLYIKLFEAAWSGDTETVKSLCVSGTNMLQIAVQDGAGFSPFSIAILRGHQKLASIIMEIAIAQYKPPENGPKYSYIMQAEDSDEESVTTDSDDDEAPTIFAKVIDEKWTIEDVSTLADNVNSKVSPLTMLEWYPQIWRAHGGDIDAAKRALTPGKKNYSVYFPDYSTQSWAHFNAIFDQEGNRCRGSLIRYAIVKNDMEMLRYLIATGTSLSARMEEHDAIKVYSISEDDFSVAIRLGRTEMIGEIIRSTGAAIPLQKMVQKSGVQIEERPRYYQGLSVRGQKRKDWADAGRGISRRQLVENEHAPLLTVAMKGNVDSTEYFLSDAPLRRYQEFVEIFRDDSRIQRLVQAKGGIHKTLKSWLELRSHLSLHMAVMSPPRKNGTQPLVDYILNVMPQTLEVKSTSGTTPLQLAFELGRMYAVKALIKAGANQATRNNLGENILHTILGGIQSAMAKYFSSILALLDQKLIQPLLLEKCGSSGPGALTPLALFMQSCSGWDNAEDVMTIIFKYSHGKDLEVMDGAGDYPLHTAVRNLCMAQVKLFVAQRPGMLYWENATGMTALDVAATAELRRLIDSPPRLNTNSSWSLKDHYVEPKNGEGSKSGNSTEMDDANGTNGIQRFLTHLAATHPGKRKLVSLFDANEIAKRLALQQQKQNEENKRREAKGLHSRGMRHGYRNYEDQQGQENQEEEEDEVSKWMFQARSFRSWDQEAWEQEVRKQLGEVEDERKEDESEDDAYADEDDSYGQSSGFVFAPGFGTGSVAPRKSLKTRMR